MNPNENTPVPGGDPEVVHELSSGTLEVSPRKVRILADKVLLVVNEIVIAAGTIRIVRHAEIDGERPEVIFDELNDDEFTMRYADDG